MKVERAEKIVEGETEKGNQTLAEQENLVWYNISGALTTL